MPSRPLKVLIADDDQNILDLLGAVFQEKKDRYEVVARCTDGQAAVDEADRTRPDVLLLDVRMPELDGIAACRKIRPFLPDSVIVMISALGEDMFVREATAAGAGSYVKKPFRIEDLMEVVDAEVELLKERAEALRTQPGQGRKLSRIWAFWAPRSGVGVTSLAINTALELVRSNQKTLFVDLDLVFPDSEQLLGLREMKNLSDMVAEDGTLDLQAAEAAVERHPSGLRCLYQHDPTDSVRLEPRHVEALLYGLGTQYRHVVLDLPPDLGDRVGVAVQAADTLWMVAGPDPVQARNTTKALGLFYKLGFDRSKIRMLANRIPRKKEDLVRSLLPGEPDMTFPEEDAVFTEAVKTACPAVLSQPSSGFSRRLRTMVATSLNLTAPVEEDPSLASRLLSLLRRE